jgi:hypothetical protein
MGTSNGRASFYKGMRSTTPAIRPREGCPDSNGPDFDFGAPAILAGKPGNGILFLAQKSGMVYAVDPDRKGELLWQYRVGKGGKLGGVQWGAATDGKLLFAAVSDVARTRVTDPATGAISSEPDPKKGGGIFALSWMASWRGRRRIPGARIGGRAVPRNRRRSR